MSNTIPISRPEVVVDETHAKAIIRNWLRDSNNKRKIALTLFEKWNVKVKGKKANLQKVITPYLDKIDSIVIKRGETSPWEVGFTTQTPDFIRYCFLQESQKLTINGKSKSESYTPLVFDVISTRTLINQSIIACYLTEHFLARILMRTEAKDLTEIKFHLKFLVDAVESIFARGGVPSKKFVISTVEGLIFIDSIMVFHTKVLLVKTYIPKHEMYPSTLKVYEKLMDGLSESQNCMLIENKCYIDLKSSVE